MAWAHVQSNAAISTGVGGGTQTYNPTSSLTAGNLLVVFIHYGSNTRDVSTVTDNLGNTYTAVTAVVNQATHGRGKMYYAKNIAAGAATLTVTWDGTMTGVGQYIGVAEYSGIDQTAPLDLSGGTGGTGTAPTTGNLAGTTAAANELGVGFCYAGGTATAGATFTSRVTTNGDIIEDKDTGAAGSTFAATFTQTGGAGQPYVVIAATFKITAGTVFTKTGIGIVGP